MKRKNLRRPKKVNEYISEKTASQSLNLKKLSPDLDLNITMLSKHLADCSDVVFRSLKLNSKDVYLIYTEGMVDHHLLSEGVLKTLFDKAQIFAGLDSLEEKIRETLPIGQVSLINTMSESMERILRGCILIFFDGIDQAICVDLRDWKTRNISVPEVEPTVRGPQESFVESLTTNISLVRKRLLHPDCKVKNKKLGLYSRTQVSVLYISSIANLKLVEEVLDRLDKISIDGILDANYIEEAIDDVPFSPFPTVQVTERPDKVAASLLDGKIIIMQENSPSALIVPALFVDFLQTPEDYFRSYWYSSILRYLRVLGLFVTTYLSAFYIAITTFHPEMIPFPLLISLATERQGVPFPASIEVILMGVSFEILQEAGTRLPRAVGQTVSIVGALIIGEAAVRAGLVSSAVVIVTAFTAISFFSLPLSQMSHVIVIFRFVSVIFSSVLGFWGIFIVSLLTLGHMASIRSFGIPYLTPLSPSEIENLDDVLARAPHWAVQSRPRWLSRKNKIRKTNT